MDKQLVETVEDLQEELVDDLEVTDAELEEAAKKVAKEEDDEDESEEDDEDKDKEEVEVKEDNFKEDLDALVESEATLSENFKGKASLIFEAALKAKVSAKVESLEEAYAENLAEEVEKIETDLVEKVDSYLSYAIEQWMTENKLVIEGGLRAEIAENFMTALHGVFVENYISVPDSKKDLVDELATKAEDLEEKLNASITTNIELSESNVNMKRASVISEASTDLSVAQAEKLAGLVEGVEFESQEMFTEKVKTLKVSYFKESAPAAIDEDTALLEETSNVTPQMQSYLTALNSFK
jgi:hypothetical protein